MSRNNIEKNELLESLTHGLRKYTTRTIIFQQNLANSLGVVQTDLKTANILNETGPITAGELAKMTGLSSGSATALIDRLEKSGFVKREKDETDRRRVIIIPIPERQKQIRSHYETLSKATKKVCLDYNECELELLLEFLLKITKVMEDEGEALSIDKENHLK